MEQLLHTQDAQLIDGLFALLVKDDPAPAEQLPDMGLSLELERAVSAIFIRTMGYGTRCSTMLLMGARGTIHFEERSWPMGERGVERLQF